VALTSEVPAELPQADRDRGECQAFRPSLLPMCFRIAMPAEAILQ
jgi:hypothetical protein